MSLKPKTPWTRRNAYLGRLRLPGFIANHVKVEFLYVPGDYDSESSPTPGDPVYLGRSS